MDDPDWQRVLVEDATEALRPSGRGLGGRGDGAHPEVGLRPRDRALQRHLVARGARRQRADRAVRRLLAELDHVDLRVWPDAGHLEAYHRHDEILEELLAR
jgi:hypothetical protein